MVTLCGKSWQVDDFRQKSQGVVTLGGKSWCREPGERLDWPGSGCPAESPEASSAEQKPSRSGGSHWQQVNLLSGVSEGALPVEGIVGVGST